MIVLKLLRESLKFALNSIFANKIRTILTLLGITIGIFMVIMVFTIFDSIEYQIKSSFEELGNKVFFVQKWPWSFGDEDYEWWKYMKRPQPSLDDLEVILKQDNTVAAAALKANAAYAVKYRNKSINRVVINGVTHQYYLTNFFEFASGRYFSETETNNGKNIVIIGHKVYEKLFGEENAIGKYVKIKGMKMLVIGVLAEQGPSSFSMSFDDMVIVPLKFLNKIAKVKNISTTLMVKAKDGVLMDDLRLDIIKSLRKERRIRPGEEENFSINEMDFLSNKLDSIFNIISIAGWVIGGFSLLVGGFGIANIMFVSVSERTKQIGIQKAIGAKKYFILFQFLFEAIFLSILGGIVGIALVYLCTLIINQFELGIEIFLSLNNILIAIIVSSVIGLVAGFVPARRAANLDPVEAIRSV